MERDKILLVDDDAAILRICTLYLQAEDFEVISLEDPANLLEVAMKERPDLVLIDINNPIEIAINSFKDFRQEASFLNTPVMVLYGSDAARNRIYQEQLILPDDHLSKPFVTEELVARIHSLMRAKKTIEKKCSTAMNFLNSVNNLEENNEGFVSIPG